MSLIEKKLRNNTAILACGSAFCLYIEEMKPRIIVMILVFATLALSLVAIVGLFAEWYPRTTEVKVVNATPWKTRWILHNERPYFFQPSFQKFSLEPGSEIQIKVIDRSGVRSAEPRLFAWSEVGSGDNVLITMRNALLDRSDPFIREVHEMLEGGQPEWYFAGDPFDEADPMVACPLAGGEELLFRRLLVQNGTAEPVIAFDDLCRWVVNAESIEEIKDRARIYRGVLQRTIQYDKSMTELYKNDWRNIPFTLGLEYSDGDYLDMPGVKIASIYQPTDPWGERFPWEPEDEIVAVNSELVFNSRQLFEIVRLHFTHSGITVPLTFQLKRGDEVFFFGALTLTIGLGP